MFGYTCAINVFELSCLLPAHTHGHLSPEPSRSAATAEEMCHRMIPRHNSNVAAQEGHSVAPILIQGKYFPQYGRLSEHSQASIMDEGFKRLSALDPSKSNLLRDKC